MGQLLLLGAVAALVVATFWASTRLAMKAGANVPLPLSLPPSPEAVTDELRALPLMGLSLRAVFRNPELLLFAAATVVVSLPELWLAPKELFSLDANNPSLWAALSSHRAMIDGVVSGAIDTFVIAFGRVAIALAVLQILKGEGWSIVEVLRGLRTKWRAVAEFAGLVALAALPGQLLTAITPGRPGWFFVSLLWNVVPFFLGLGAAILANENRGGIESARYSASLVMRVWPTRFWGQLLIRSPIMLLWGAGPLLIGVLAYTGFSFTLPTAMPILWTVLSMMATGIPLTTVSAVFDAALYLRVTQSHPPVPELPSALSVA